MLVLSIIPLHTAIPSAIASEAYYDVFVRVSESLEDCAVSLSFSLPLHHPSRNIVLHLSDRANIGSCWILHDGVKMEAEWRRLAGDSLEVLTDEASASGQLTVGLCYSLPCDTLSFGEIVLRREDRWYPMVVPTVPFRYRIEVECPPHYIALSSGRCQLLECRLPVSTWAWVYDLPTHTMPLVLFDSSRSSTRSVVANGVTVRFISNSADDSTAKSIMHRCVDSYETFQGMFGWAPVSEINVVEVPGFQAVQSLAGLLLVGNAFVKHYWLDAGHQWPPHEIAHQWIGNALLTNYLDGDSGKLFLEESLAEFLRIEYVRFRFGNDSAASVLASCKVQADAALRDTIPPSLYAVRFRGQVDFAVVYKSGPLIWNGLKEKMGDNLWRQFLRELVKEFAYKKLTYLDVRETLSELAPSRDVVSWLDKSIGYVQPSDD